MTNEERQEFESGLDGAATSLQRAGIDRHTAGILGSLAGAVWSLRKAIKLNFTVQALQDVSGQACALGRGGKIHG